MASMTLTCRGVIHSGNGGKYLMMRLALWQASMKARVRRVSIKIPPIGKVVRNIFVEVILWGTDVFVNTHQ